MAGHYEVLGIRPGASASEVRSAYVALARRHHPDRAGGSTERMQAVNEAWAVLGDPEARRRYDRSLIRTAPTAPWSAGPSGPAAAPPRPSHEVDLDDLLDDRPIHPGTIRLPPWLALVPPGTGLLGVAVLFAGILLRLAVVTAFGFMLVLLCGLLFVISPFIAFAASRRRANQ